MKNIVKQTLILAVLTLAIPAIAAEGPTKGTKSYQSARSEKPAQPEQTDEQAITAADDVSQIAPAAGDTTDAKNESEQGKTMREEMRLPRKN